MLIKGTNFMVIHSCSEEFNIKLLFCVLFSSEEEQHVAIKLATVTVLMTCQ